MLDFNICYFVINMNKISYSIIISHYNIPSLLARLLQTIPQRDDIQIIVVDDCSTDCLNELCQLKKKYDLVEWYDTGTNGGAGKARNIGLNHAKGKYLIFADSDDYFNLCFEDALDRYKDTDFDIIYFTVNSVNTETFQNTHESEWLNRYFYKLSAKELKFYYTQPWAKFIKRDLVNSFQIRFHETVISNDVFFSTQVDLHAQKCTKDYKSIYCWTTRDESVSRSLTPEKAIIRLHEDNLRRRIIDQAGCEDLHSIYLPIMLEIIFNSKNSDLIDRAVRDCENIGLKKKDLQAILFHYKLNNKFDKFLQLLKRNLKRVMICCS